MAASLNRPNIMAVTEPPAPCIFPLPFPQNMKEEYLLYDDLNVVVVDWLSGSGPPYTQAVANIRLIGAILGRLVLDLEVGEGWGLGWVREGRGA